MRRWFVSLVLAGLAGSCAAPKGNGKPQPPPAPSDGVTRIDTDDPGLTFRLREGAEGGGSERIKVAPARPLGEAEAQKILARLPAMAVEADDQKDFAMRGKTLPAPRTGKTIAQPFPPPEQKTGADQATAGPLEVARFLPEGEVPLAPHLSVTFTQPMVPVTSLAELEKRPVPVKLTPQPEGRWRWVGTKTLLFEPRSLEDESGEVTPGRLPMATEYTVEIPAGTKPEVGTPLAKDVRFAFATPPPKVTQFWPSSGPVVRDPIIYVAFDQHVSPEAVLGSIKLMAGDDTVGVRLASETEWKADTQIADLAQHAQKGRWLAFRPVKTLPADAYISVAIGPGTPSAEGPRKTTEAQEYNFRTYGPLVVEWQNCETKKDECTPFTPFVVRFSNPIDAAKFDKSMIKVVPELPGLKATVYGRQLNI